MNTPPAVVSCVRCAGFTELDIRNFIGGILYCGPCAEMAKDLLRQKRPTCSHGLPVRFLGETDLYCAACSGQGGVSRPCDEAA